MIVPDSIENIERTVAHLQQADEDYEKYPAVLLSPKWFLDEVAKSFSEKKETITDEVESIAGIKVIVNDDMEEPVTLSGDGRMFPVLPKWARKNRSN